MWHEFWQLFREHLYTVSQKRSHLMFDNNFGKFGPIFKILSPVDCEKILYVHVTKISISPAIYWYTTLANSKIQKRYRIFTLNVTINMFN